MENVYVDQASILLMDSVDNAMAKKFIKYPLRLVKIIVLIIRFMIVSSKNVTVFQAIKSLMDCVALAL